MNMFVEIASLSMAYTVLVKTLRTRYLCTTLQNVSGTGAVQKQHESQWEKGKKSKSVGKSKNNGNLLKCISDCNVLCMLSCVFD